ncbi:hypothetical protein DRH27_01535 [Candidatus Falkowbacteria bacterium]|nr:MAG: hypothetical protein DRH27_01535 [Candidatus Falkowbacteria bacterium]
MKFSKAKIFLFCCVSFIVGIAMASFIPPKFGGFNVLWFSLVIILSVAIVLFWKNKKAVFFFFIALFLFLGVWRFGLSLPQDFPDKIWHYNNQTVILEGFLGNEPDVRLKNQKLDFNVGKIFLYGEDKKEMAPQAVFGKVLVTADLYPEYEYGENLRIICDLQAPEEFNGFAYDRYLARYNIYSVCYYPQIIKLGGNEGNLFYIKIFQLKNKFRQVINRGLGEPEASLARAIMLGDKRGIPDNLRLTLSRIGLSHIIAISGMHISILSVLVMGLLFGAGVPRKYAFYISTLFLIFYITLIGLPASAMRAGLMGFLVLWALHLGRLNKTINSIVFSAAILLLINPKLLRSDIGFQLSFLAVLGIVYGYPIIEAWFKKIKIPKFKGMRSILSLTVAAQIFTMPILMLNFSTISLIAPFSNLLILWALPFLLIATLAAMGLSLLFSGLGSIFFLGTKFIIDYILKVGIFLEKLPFSYIEFNNFWIGWATLFYLALILFIINSVKKEKKHKLNN